MNEQFRKYHEWIMLYNTGRLEGEDLEKFRSLLKEDPRLRAETRLDAELDSVILDEDVMELRKMILHARKARERRLRSRDILLMAASFAILAALFIMLVLIAGKNRVEQDLAGKSNANKKPKLEQYSGKNRAGVDSVSKANREKLIAAHYNPFPPLENLVGIAMRSSVITIREPSPRLKVSRDSKIRFAWKTEEGEVTAFEICDNRGKAVESIRKPVCCSFSLRVSGLDPGLYYWKCFAGKNLVRVGKFEIR